MRGKRGCVAWFSSPLFCFSFHHFCFVLSASVSELWAKSRSFSHSEAPVSLKLDPRAESFSDRGGRVSTSMLFPALSKSPGKTGLMECFLKTRLSLLESLPSSSSLAGQGKKNGTRRPQVHYCTLPRFLLIFLIVGWGAVFPSDIQSLPKERGRGGEKKKKKNAS